MNNMNDDYLWDKSGEPDLEIQQLEQVLGTLRYQPRSLDIPVELAPVQKRAFFPRLLAIAATITIMLFGFGLWVSLQRQRTAEVSKFPNKAATGGVAAVVVPDTGNDVGPVAPKFELTDKPKRRPVNHGALSHEVARNLRRPKAGNLELAAHEVKEAQAAKEQLMIALRVASSKLNFAQKKAQEINSDNQTHNQHKIG